MIPLLLVVVAAAVPDPAPYAAVLSAAVKGERVDYAVVEKMRPKLQQYLQAAAAASSSEPAFLVNAYNATVLDEVIEHGLHKQAGAKVLDVKGFFDGRLHTVAGQQLTLNALEEKLRRMDPRVHFVVNCASVDCPPLKNTPYSEKTWEADLEAQTKAFLQKPEQLSVKGDAVVTTQLFEWYAGDFQKLGGVLAFAQKYTQEPLQQKKLQYRSYNWALNKA